MKRVILIRSNPVRPYPRLEKTANALIKNGYKVHVLAWDRDCDYDERDEILHLPDGNASITRIGIKGEFSGGIKKNLFPLLKFQRFIFRWLKKHQSDYDIIHAYDFDTGFISSKCAKLYKKQMIYDIPDYYVDSHGLKGSRIGSLIQRAENKVIDFAQAVIICTEKRKEQIEGTHPKRLLVIHNTPYENQLELDEHYEIKKGSESRELKIAYIGVFGKTRFLDKIAEIVSKRDDCELHIGGYGSNMEGFFEDMSKKYSNIYYYGKVPYNQTLQIEKACDVLCAMYDPSVPNHKYAAPNKFYESLMLGKPIIMARNTGMDGIVEENDIGIVINYDEKDFDDALYELINRKNEWDSMGRRARKLYDEMFSWKVMENRLIDLYNTL